MAARCCCPPDNWRGVLRRVGVDAHTFEQLHPPLLGLLTRDLADMIGPSVTFSRIVLCAKRLNDWNTMPISAAQSGERGPLFGQRPALETDRAAVDRLQPVDRPAQRGLAAAGRADDHDDLAGGNGQVDVSQDVNGAEMLVHVLEAQERYRVHEAALAAIYAAQLAVDWRR